eukprot:GEMP01011778.1.p1 GENE.GEMP01011778.1~~GEMP01011778.1.p1  ORF type:complete len:376 (+),score=61.30 GEMP01011778.1:23-1129(+)
MSTDIDAQRRRLSLGVCAPVKDDPKSPKKSTGENRGLLVQLKEQSLKALVPEAIGQRLSYSSQTDRALKRHSSYDEKETVSEGDPVTNETLKDLGIGIACKKGLKPESPNQDSFSFHYVADMFSLYGIYDGHGPEGHIVSNFVREFLPKLFLQHSKRASEPEVALKDSFMKCQELIEMQTQEKQMNASMSGTTVTMLYRPSHEQYVVVAHVGDSRAVLARVGGEATDLTVDHKPNLPKERERIEARGGRVVFDGFYNYRVFAKGAMYPGLNMSRALGDTLAHKVAGLSEVPDVERVAIDRKKDKALILCTDGVWEFIESAEAVKLVLSYETNQALEAAERLTQESWDRWMSDSAGEISDDITAMVIHL